MRPDGIQRNLKPLVGWSLLGFAVTLLCGLGLASRGTLFRPEFWIEWTLALREFGGGISHLAIAGAIREDPAAGFFLGVMFVCYLFAVCRAVREWCSRELTPRHLIIGLVGLYGLETLMLFIGRSHPFNLHHPCAPFCVVLVSFLFEIHESARRAGLVSMKHRRRFLLSAALDKVPSIGVYVLLFIIFVHPTFLNYPNVYRWLVQDQWTSLQIPDENYIFLSRRDCPLPDKLRKEVKDFRAVTAAIREVSEGGRRSVAVVDGYETAYLVETDLRPYFRYCPVIPNLLLEKQLATVKQTLIDNPPDYVVVPTTAPEIIPGIPAGYEYRSIMEVVERHYSLDRRVARKAIYRRQGLDGQSNSER